MGQFGTMYRIERTSGQQEKKTHSKRTKGCNKVRRMLGKKRGSGAFITQ